ncbi:MAG: smalltalk protein [Bacteroides sp.]|nr:smalltalk protein [Bacteroides sp.]
MENNNKNVWSKILHIIITVLTAVATTFGVSSCIS